MAQHNMALSGTFTFRPSTFIAVLKDVVASLERHGFERVYFLNGHGGNIATITAAFSEIHAQRSLPGSGGALAVRLSTWFGGRRVEKHSREPIGASEGRRATPSEVATRL